MEDNKVDALDFIDFMKSFNYTDGEGWYSIHRVLFMKPIPYSDKELFDAYNFLKNNTNAHKTPKQ